MTIFFKSLGFRIAKGITMEFVELLDGEESWRKATAKDYEANAKA